MKTLNSPFKLEDIEIQQIPFLHFFQPNFINDELAGKLLDWFQKCTLWVPKKANDFYEVADFDLVKSTIPSNFYFLKQTSLLNSLICFLRNYYPSLNGKVDVTAHRLTNGEKIKIHTDHGDLQQRFRIIIQFNRNWSLQNGGLIMLFDNDNPLPESDTTRIYLPLHGSAWGFEISKDSYHAVSPVLNNTRYSITYTFY